MATILEDAVERGKFYLVRSLLTNGHLIYPEGTIVKDRKTAVWLAFKQIHVAMRTALCSISTDAMVDDVVAAIDAATYPFQRGYTAAYLHTNILYERSRHLVESRYPDRFQTVEEIKRVLTILLNQQMFELVKCSLADGVTDSVLIDRLNRLYGGAWIDANYQDMRTGQTILHLVCSSEVNRLEVAKHLITMLGCRASLLSWTSESALLLALKSFHSDIGEFLLPHSSEVIDKGYLDGPWTPRFYKLLYRLPVSISIDRPESFNRLETSIYQLLYLGEDDGLLPEHVALTILLSENIGPVFYKVVARLLNKISKKPEHVPIVLTMLVLSVGAGTLSRKATKKFRDEARRELELEERLLGDGEAVATN